MSVPPLDAVAVSPVLSLPFPACARVDKKPSSVLVGLETWCLRRKVCRAAGGRPGGPVNYSARLSWLQ